jgi:hypothetical protein
VLRTGFGLFSDILPGSVADLIGTNPPYDKTFQGGVLGTRRHSWIGGLRLGCWMHGNRAGRDEQRGRCNRGCESDFYFGISPRPALVRIPAGKSPQSCLPPVAITAIPDGKLHAPYFMEWSLGMEHQLGTTASVKAQYVGTRAVNQPYSTQVNGYQTVCQGCFAPFPYLQPTDPTIRRGDAVFHRREQSLQRSSTYRDEAPGTWAAGTGQLHLEPLHGYGFEWRISAIFRGRNSFSATGRSWRAITALAITTSGTISTGSMCISCQLKVRNHSLGYALNGWQISGTLFWHSGVPFSVAEHALFRGWKRHCARAAGRSLPVSFPEFRGMSIIRFRASHSREHCSGSIRMPSFDRRSERADN